MKHILPLLMGLTLVLTGCTLRPQPAEPAAVTTQPAPSAPEETALPPESTLPPETTEPEPQLIAFTSTREEAEEIARQYGITLAFWDNGLALYTTREDPEAVVRRGEQEGLPELSLNEACYLFE